MAEWKEWMEEWKESMRESIEEWKEMMEEWKSDVGGKKFKFQLPPLPRLPIPPLKPVPRPKVVASRIGVDELTAIDMLIEAGLFNTRSEAIDFLVREGLKARKDVLEKVRETLDEIRRIRKEAVQYTQRLRKEIGLEKAPDTEPDNERRKCSRCDRNLTSLPEDISRCPYCGSELEDQ